MSGDLADALVQLSEEATPSPWFSVSHRLSIALRDRDRTKGDDAYTHVMMTASWWDKKEFGPTRDRSISNISLVQILRNNTQTIIAALRAVETAKVALAKIYGELNSYEPDHGRRTRAMITARAAIIELEMIAP